MVGKGEIARKEQFLLFPHSFLLNQIFVSPFVRIFDIISLFAAELEEPEIGISGRGLTSPNDQFRPVRNVSTDDKLNIIQKLKFLLYSMENIVGKKC